MTFRPTSFHSLAIVSVAAFLIGCVQGVPLSNPSPSIANPDVEGCEHLKEGPAKAVTATSLEATSSIPNVNEAHTRYDITLVGTGSQKVGKVLYNSAKAADYIVFLNQNMPLKVKNGNGAEIAIEQSATGSVTCGDIKGRHVVPLGVGGHALYFGPTDLASVSLLIEVGAPHQEGSGHTH